MNTMHLLCNVLTEREQIRLYLYNSNKGFLAQLNASTSGRGKKEELWPMVVMVELGCGLMKLVIRMYYY